MKLLSIMIKNSLADKSHNVVADFTFMSGANKEKIKVVVVLSNDYIDDHSDYKNIIANELSSFSEIELKNIDYKIFRANSDEGVAALKVWARKNNV